MRGREWPDALGHGRGADGEENALKRREGGEQSRVEGGSAKRVEGAHSVVPKDGAEKGWRGCDG